MVYVVFAVWLWRTLRANLPAHTQQTPQAPWTNHNFSKYYNEIMDLVVCAPSAQARPNATPAQHLSNTSWPRRNIRNIRGFHFLPRELNLVFDGLFTDDAAL